MRHLLSVLVLSVVFMSGCNRQPELAVSPVTDPVISAGDEIPLPQEKVVLTVFGNISAANDGDQISFDIPTLEQAGLVQYTVADPWLQTDVTYTGVLLSDLLELAQAPDSATVVSVVALDDYSADIPISEIEAWPILLATRSDGEYMAVATNGPTRIIFPYDQYTDLTEARNMSVWNVASLEVK